MQVLKGFRRNMMVMAVSRHSVRDRSGAAAAGGCTSQSTSPARPSARSFS